MVDQEVFPILVRTDVRCLRGLELVQIGRTRNDLVRQVRLSKDLKDLIDLKDFSDGVNDNKTIN